MYSLTVCMNRIKVVEGSNARKPFGKRSVRDDKQGVSHSDLGHSKEMSKLLGLDRTHNIA